jgi:hypothetical protein
MYTSIDFSSQTFARRGSQGGLIHQSGVWLGRELKLDYCYYY